MNDFATSLWISALGMGLVFGAIIVLWLMMVLLTLLTADKRAVSSLSVPPKVAAETEADESKAQAAVIAVAMALAQQESSIVHSLPTPPTAIVSAWQLGMRTRSLAQKGNARGR